MRLSAIIDHFNFVCDLFHFRPCGIVSRSFYFNLNYRIHAINIDAFFFERIKVVPTSYEIKKRSRSESLRTFALIFYAHLYCARNLCRNAMLRHARARAQRKKSFHMKGWQPFR